MGMANLKDTWVQWGAKPRLCPRGSLVTSLRELSKKTGADKGSIERQLKYLALRDTLVVETETRGTFISIRNFELYQSKGLGAVTDEGQETDTGADTGADATRDSNEELIIKKERKKEVTTPWAEILFRIWNENKGPHLPKALALSSERIKSANQRFKEFPDEEFWTEVVKRIAESSFCTGNNDRGWKADFDFFLRPGTHLAVNEGKYDTKKGAPQTFGVLGA
jgi:hypothetical protein